MKFPIYTDNYNSKKEYIIEVESEKFTLKELIEVNLEINYLYGGKTPYNLKIIPCDSKLNSKDFKVTWVENTEKLEIKGVSFPKPKEYKKDIISKKLLELNEKIEKINIDSGYIYVKESFEKYAEELNKFKNKFKGFIIQEIKDERFIFDELLNEKLIKKLIEICDYKDEKYVKIKKKFNEYEDYKGYKENIIFNDFIYKIKLFLISFGAVNFEKLNIQKTSKNELKYRSLLFSTKYNIFEKVLKLFKDKKSYNYKELVSGMALNAWLDEKFIKDLSKQNSEILKNSLKYVIKDLLYLNKNFEDKIKECGKEKLWKVTNIFRNSLEFILSLLIVKDKEVLLKQIGLSQVEIKKIVRLIKEIDRKIQIENEDMKESFEKNMRLSFEIKKPEALKNMSDLAYVTFSHLIGNKEFKLISIQVKEE